MSLLHVDVGRILGKCECLVDGRNSRFVFVGKVDADVNGNRDEVLKWLRGIEAREAEILTDPALETRLDGQESLVRLIQPSMHVRPELHDRQELIHPFSPEVPGVGPGFPAGQGGAQHLGR